MMFAYRHIKRNRLHRGFQKFINTMLELLSIGIVLAKKKTISLLISVVRLSVPPLIRNKLPPSSLIFLKIETYKTAKFSEIFQIFNRTKMRHSLYELLR